MIVLENVVAIPIIELSIKLKPNKKLIPNPVKPKTAALKIAIKAVFDRSWRKFLGCKSNPSRNSKNMMPICPISSRVLASLTSSKP